MREREREKEWCGPLLTHPLSSQPVIRHLCQDSWRWHRDKWVHAFLKAVSMNLSSSSRNSNKNFASSVFGVGKRETILTLFNENETTG